MSASNALLPEYCDNDKNEKTDADETLSSYPWHHPPEPLELVHRPIEHEH